jgi:hypothetical protein
VIFLPNNKRGVFSRLSNTGLKIRKKHESRKGLSKDSIFESGPVIDADFVDIEEKCSHDSDSSLESDSESIDPELLKNLREYLKTRSQAEISEIFEEVRKLLESRTSEGKYSYGGGKGTPYSEKFSVKDLSDFSKKAFAVFRKTASYGKMKIVDASKVASSKASSIASEGKESIKISSEKFNRQWNNLSPRDQKIITEMIITMIEFGLLKGASRSRKAAFAVLSSVYRHQNPGKKDLEDFVDGLQKLLKRKR